MITWIVISWFVVGYLSAVWLESTVKDKDVEPIVCIALFLAGWASLFCCALLIFCEHKSKLANFLFGWGKK